MSLDMEPSYLQEHAYLIARGVRQIAIAGHCQASHKSMLSVASQVEVCAVQGAIPFVVNRGDGIADYGYAAAQWALDLYQWVVCAPVAHVPRRYAHHILGLLLGYSSDAIREFDENSTSRRFTSAVSVLDEGFSRQSK